MWDRTFILKVTSKRNRQEKLEHPVDLNNAENMKEGSAFGFWGRWIAISLVHSSDLSGHCLD